MLARAETAEQRSAIYSRLMARNRLIAILRLGMPALGVLVVALFVAQLYLKDLTRNFSAAGFGFDRNALIVEAPRFTGATPDGSTWRLEAEAAGASLADFGAILLRGITLSLTDADGAVMSASADRARFLTANQILAIEGTLTVSRSDGSGGTFEQATIDWGGEVLVAEGAVSLILPGGMALDAEAARFDFGGGDWSFTRPRVGLGAPWEDTP